MSVTSRDPQGAIDVREMLVPRLRCPAGSPVCGSGLIMDGDTLACECGKSYHIHAGVLDLRLTGGWDIEGHTSVEGDRYLSSSFLNSFYRRQYGCLIETSPTVQRKTPGRIPEFRGGAEAYYQTMIGMVVPHIRKDAFVVDIGCALGRLTGEMARAGARDVGGRRRGGRRGGRR